MAVFSEEIDQMIIIGVASFVAMATFVSVALPLLNRTEKKERYQNVIEKKRKDLFIQTREASLKKGGGVISKYRLKNPLSSSIKSGNSSAAWAKKPV